MNLGTLTKMLLFVGAISPSMEQTPRLPRQTGLASLPQCALNCITTAASRSPCGLVNQTCLCADAAFEAETEVCVLSNCTIKQALFTKNTTSTACQAPIRNRQYLLTTTSTTLRVFSAVFVLARFGFKLFVRVPIGADDWLILATLVVGVPQSISIVHGTTAHGLGRDIWTVSFEDITLFAKYFYVQEVIYFVLLMLLKLSLLTFFLRIFPGQTVRKIIWTTIVFVTLYGVAFALIAIFQCWPIDFVWTKWDGENLGRGRCLNNNHVAWANASINIAFDFWMLAIPLQQLRRLQLHWKKKIGVGLMFSVGAFVTIVSILRLQSLVLFANSLNPTWDTWDVCNWSTIEINVGIICACMPAMRQLLARLFPILRGSSAQHDRRGRSGSLRSRETPMKRITQGSRSRAANGIILTKSYSVNHGTAYDHDETSLVHMQTLTRKDSKTESIRSDVSPTHGWHHYHAGPPFRTSPSPNYLKKKAPRQNHP